MVYTHAKVKAIELMFVDALLQANSYLDICSQLDEPAGYWKLDDTILKTIETAPDRELKEARDLILRIRRRDLYQKSSGITLKEEDDVVSNVKIDLTRGKDNPLESIKFFKNYDSEEKFCVFPQSSHSGSDKYNSETEPKVKVNPRREPPPRPINASSSTQSNKQREQKDNTIDLERLDKARRRLQENYQEANNGLESYYPATMAAAAAAAAGAEIFKN